ncbi:DUF6452 family protein [Flavobacterium cellulosilyticum]|uniref:Uncharacterized protein n=1 Tax=Flavobacterium cellulosilyticum TaxID=2541731 RepID=A0A4R5C7N3_9FLAO|nr:DUF6452 family protein [Flavobacterium cellulosilyticum]TDD94120.1 hypothetical protein E0F76_17670 [Flavobacterium cellulosilyticum]
MKKIITLILIAMFSISSCEKDDICDANTPTTPRLIIEFYDINNSTILKNVTNLKVIGKGKTEGIIFNTSTTDSKYLTNGTKISIPLKTDMDSATYQFILNSGNANASLIDTDEVTFNYTRKDIFVSRACGFKTVFSLNLTNPYTQTAVPATKPKWMYISVDKSNIENENETHIKVYF